MGRGTHKFVIGMFTYIQNAILSLEVYLFLEHFLNEMDAVGIAVSDTIREIEHHCTVVQQVNNHLANNYSTGLAGSLSHLQYLKLITDSAEQLMATYDASQLRISTGHARLQAIMANIETAIYRASDAPLRPRTTIGFREFQEHFTDWGMDQSNVDVRFNVLRGILAEITTHVMQEFARVMDPSYLSQSTEVINQQANIYMNAMNQECLAAIEHFRDFNDYYELYCCEARIFQDSTVNTISISKV